MGRRHNNKASCERVALLQGGSRQILKHDTAVNISTSAELLTVVAAGCCSCRISRAVISMRIVTRLLEVDGVRRTQ